MKQILVSVFLLALWHPMTAQDKINWYSLDDDQAFDSKILETEDCKILKTKESEGLSILEYQSKALFFHTNSNFKKWSDKKYLMKAYAHIYKVNKNQFVIVDIIINSTNAKRTYGDLEKFAKMKFYLSNGEYIYLENLEKNKGKLNRSAENTEYRMVMALDKSDKKLLQKNYLVKIGVMWEEAYQEYEVLNIDLIKNQLNCLNN